MPRRGSDRGAFGWSAANALGTTAAFLSDFARASIARGPDERQASLHAPPLSLTGITCEFRIVVKLARSIGFF